MSVNYTLVLEVRKMNSQKTRLQPKGHSTTTWTDFFFHFLTPSPSSCPRSYWMTPYIGGEGVKKSPKLCSRNIWMVPIFRWEQVASSSIFLINLSPTLDKQKKKRNPPTIKLGTIIRPQGHTFFIGSGSFGSKIGITAIAVIWKKNEKH